MTIQQLLKEQEEEYENMLKDYKIDIADNFPNSNPKEVVLNFFKNYNTKIIKTVCKEMRIINNEKKNKEIWGKKGEDWEQRFDEKFPQFCSGYVYQVKDIKDFIREERKCLIKECLKELVAIGATKIGSEKAKEDIERFLKKKLTE